MILSTFASLGKEDITISTEPVPEEVEQARDRATRAAAALPALRALGAPGSSRAAPRQHKQRVLGATHPAREALGTQGTGG